MKLFGITVWISIFCGVAAPAAMASDYYLTVRYVSAADLGELALLVNPDSIGVGSEGYKVADITSVNSTGVVVTVFKAQIDCATHGWRVTYQTDYRTDQLLAPDSRSVALGQFNTVPDDAPSRKTLDFVCNWPGSASGVEKIVVADPVSLSKKVSPMLKFIHQGSDN